MFIFLLNKGIYKKLARIFSPRLSNKKSTLWTSWQGVNILWHYFRSKILFKNRFRRIR